MRKDFIIRFSTVLLAILTATTVVFAIINFQKESQFSTPDDGVWWIEQNGALVAKRVTSGGPGDHAGIKPGDRLLTIDGRWTDTLTDLFEATGSVKPGTTVPVKIQRDGKEMELKVKPLAGL